MTKKMKESIKYLIDDFNDAPWTFDSDRWTYNDGFLIVASRGLDALKEALRRDSIRLHHKEEAMNGML